MQVETIGDAYMLVAGVPRRNGIKHAYEICMTLIGFLFNVTGKLIMYLLGMLAVARETRVQHMDSAYQLSMRGGVHTGSVAAEVIGIHAPRYCLFGVSVSFEWIKRKAFCVIN